MSLNPFPPECPLLYFAISCNYMYKRITQYANTFSNLYIFKFDCHMWSYC